MPNLDHLVHMALDGVETRHIIDDPTNNAPHDHDFRNERLASFEPREPAILSHRSSPPVSGDFASPGRRGYTAEPWLSPRLMTTPSLRVLREETEHGLVLGFGVDEEEFHRTMERLINTPPVPKQHRQRRKRQRKPIPQKA